MVGCRQSSCERKKNKKEKLSNEILRKATSKLKQETDLHPIGTIGQMLNEVQKLGLSFYYYKPTDIVEGRKLLIKSVNTLMDEVNQEKRIHPYLIRYPFLPRNIEIEIYIRSPEGSDMPIGNLWIVEACDGVLRYDIHHPTDRGFVTVYKETYEEALERIKDPSLPLVPFQPDTKKISPEELSKLRKGISMVTDDGTILYLNEAGQWTKERK